MAKSKADKKKQKQGKSVRANYYLHQLVPIITYCATITAVSIGGIILQDYVPLTASSLLSQNKSTIDSMSVTVNSLNTQKKTLLEQKQILEQNISDIRNKRESEGSLRFYTANLPAYGRYTEFRANSNSVEIISVDIKQDENKVDYVILGDYPDLINFFNSLETREIYYIENFELLPSFSNSGSYVKYTANFNLDESITQRYEKKVKYEKPVNEGNVMEPNTDGGQPSQPTDGSLSDINVNTDTSQQPTDESPVEPPTAPDDYINTDRQEPQVEQPTNGTQTGSEANTTEQGSTPNDTVIVEPLN